MQLPPPREVPPELPDISADPLVDAVTGLATAAVGAPLGPIALPGIVALPGNLAPPGNLALPGSSAPGPRGGLPAAQTRPGVPQNSQAVPKTGRPDPPAFSAGSGTPSESFRAGYGNYLRSAGVGQIVAVAIPGVVGILALTGAGGLLGYRQARAGRAMRGNGTARFTG